MRLTVASFSDDKTGNELNKLKSVFHASVLLLIMNFITTLSKKLSGSTR